MTGQRKSAKVGVLINSIEGFGGIGKIAIEQVKNMRKLGVDAELLVFSDWGEVNKYQEISEDIPIVRLAGRLPEKWRIRKKVPLFTILDFCHFIYPFVLLKYIKKREWDVIINHESYLTFFLLRIKKKKHIPYFQSIWDPMSYITKRVYTKGVLKYLNFFLYRLALVLDKKFIKNSNLVVLGGDAHEKFVKKTGKEYRIIYPSVYPEREIKNEKEKYVFIVTAWKKGKNPEYILELLSKMPELEIKMGGIWLDEEYKKEFEKLILEKKISENQLKILGGLSESELKEYLLNARVALQTNDDRGFGMTALEAAGCGCSFIVPRGQGVCRLFENGKEGFFVKEKDTSEITRLLQKFMSDPAWAAEMGKRAWERVKNNYSWEQHARQLIDLIEKYAIDKKTG